jgi:hypothetical protein
VHFQDILKANSEELLHLDTFAVRNLILTAPRSMRVLSSMQVGVLDHCCRPRLLAQCAASYAEVLCCISCLFWLYTPVSLPSSVLRLAEHTRHLCTAANLHLHP